MDLSGAVQSANKTSGGDSTTDGNDDTKFFERL